MVLEENTRKIEVRVNPPYPIYVGAGLAELMAKTISHNRLAIITDSQVKALHLDTITSALKQAGKSGQAYEIPAGEDSKSFETLSQVLSHMAHDGFDRGSAVLALGGGVVGDLAGFAAASYMRGIDFYQVPTSLLAMVDASVGGKTGINLPEGKNLVGAFWQPRAVFIDISFLETLPDTEFRQGAVELYKHGLIRDENILPAMQNPDFQKEAVPLLIDLIAKSVGVKADIVAEDEKEIGVRAFLNFGHNLAHALEAASDHRLSHGDAVAYGLVFDAKLGQARGWQDLTQETLNFLRWVNPQPLPTKDFSVLEPYLKRDKKNKDGRMKFVLLESLGKPQIVDDLRQDELESAWTFLLEQL
ncbi:MAG: 3-dehydroquinate synthase [Trueperaceae bacterium]|nr:3-dehydroquinate synthase [Trueperaceae bacterium]